MLWFEQFKFYNWGGINLELDSFLTTPEKQQQFLAMIDKTIELVDKNTINGEINIDMIDDYPVTLGMLSNFYPVYFIIEFLNQLKSLFV